MPRIPYAEEGREAAGATPVYEQLNGCGYCQGHHVPLGKQAGLNEGQIDQRGPSGIASEAFTPAEQAVIRFAYETSAEVMASDEAIEALQKHFDNAQIAEIAFVVAGANFIQRIGRNLGAELEF